MSTGTSAEKTEINASAHKATDLKPCLKNVTTDSSKTKSSYDGDSIENKNHHNKSMWRWHLTEIPHGCSWRQSQWSHRHIKPGSISHMNRTRHGLMWNLPSEDSDSFSKFLNLELNECVLTNEDNCGRCMSVLLWGIDIRLFCGTRRKGAFAPDLLGGNLHGISEDLDRKFGRKSCSGGESVLLILISMVWESWNAGAKGIRNCGLRNGA